MTDPYEGWTLVRIAGEIARIAKDLATYERRLAIMEAAGTTARANALAAAELQRKIATARTTLQALETAKTARTAVTVVETANSARTALQTANGAGVVARLTALGLRIAPAASNPALVGGAAVGAGLLAACLAVYLGARLIGVLSAESSVEAGPAVANRATTPQPPQWPNLTSALGAPGSGGAQTPVSQELVLDHFEVEVVDRWVCGAGGSKVVYEAKNVGPGTRSFAPPEDLAFKWDGGHYRVSMSMQVKALPDRIHPGEKARIAATAKSTISTGGLGFSRSAFLNLSAGQTEQATEPNAENKTVNLQASAGPVEVTPSQRIELGISSGLNSVNDHRYHLTVVAVYRPA